MSGNDLQADITTRLKGQGLTQATQGIDKVKQASDKLITSQRDLQRQSKATFSQVKADTQQSKEKVDRLNRSLQALEGPLGSIGRKSFQAFNLGGGLGKAAGAAIVGTIALTGAMRLLNMSVDANVEKVRKQVEAQREVTRAQEDAAKSASQAANAAGKAAAPSIRQAMSRLGEGGFERAQQFAANSKAGISTEDAVRGMGAAQALPDPAYGRAVKAAEQVAATGEMSFPDAIMAILNDPFLKAELTAERRGGQNSANVAKRLVVGARRQDATQDNLDAAGTSINNVMTAGKGSLLNRVNDQDRFGKEIDAIHLQNFQRGMGESAIDEEAARARDPVGRATADVLDRILKLQRDAIEIEKAHGVIYNAVYRKLEQLGLKYKIGSEALPGSNL